MKITSAAQLATVVAKRNVSVLSIDLFDTLVYRTCTTPDRVFRAHFFAIRKLVPNVNTAEEWVELRKACEREVAEARFPEEIHIHEIYDLIAKRLSLPRDITFQIQQLELDAEMEFIAPFAEVVRVLRQIRNSGVKIVVNTDTYLPASFIKALVSRIIPDCDVQVQCSSETRLPKRSGLAFDLLKKTFVGETILHIGDNFNSDVRRARQRGVAAYLVQWERGRWLHENHNLTGYLEAMGVYSFPTPADRPKEGTCAAARDEMAWRWGIVLCDFLLCLRKYVEQVGADEIWFLSRDSEAMYRALIGTDRFFDARVRYVHTSRAATYPIFAELDAKLFERTVGRLPKEADVAEGRDLIAAYNSQVHPDTRRIVMVDAGWKGRLQVALQSAMPDRQVYGFYFSLDDLAEPGIRERARCFLLWNPGHVNQPAVECLFGFEERSCIGYSRENSEAQWRPKFRRGPNDGAPVGYCDSLRTYLSEFLSKAHLSAGAGTIGQRVSAVRTMCMYPDRVAAAAFDGWLAGVPWAAAICSLPPMEAEPGEFSGFWGSLGTETSGRQWRAGVSALSPLLLWRYKLT